MVVLDPTDEPPSFWAAHVGAAWGAPARDAALARSRLPGSGAAVAPPAQLCSQHAHLVPDPRSAISPNVTGCLHLHPTPQDRGLLLSPLPSLVEPSHAGTGTWFPWQLPGAGIGGGTWATQPRSMEKGVAQGKNFDGKEQADQFDQKLSRQMIYTSTPFSSERS